MQVYVRENKKAILARCHQWSTRPDPQSRPVVIIVFTHVRPYVRLSPLSQNLANKTNFKWKQCSLLAEWIIDDTCLVCFVLLDIEKWGRTDGWTYHMCENNGVTLEQPRGSIVARRLKIAEKDTTLFTSKRQYRKRWGYDQFERLLELVTDTRADLDLSKIAHLKKIDKKAAEQRN